MKTKVKKWGNSLAVRLPGGLAKEAGFSAEKDIDISLSSGKIVLSAVKRSRYEMSELLAGITKANIHKAEETGKPRGNEIW